MLLCACSNGVDVPVSLPHKFLQCIAAGSGTKVLFLWRNWFINFDFVLQRGVAQNIANGLLCADSQYKPSTFAPHLMVPESANFIQLISNNENNRLELTGLNKKLTDQDLKRMTLSEIFLPTSFEQFKQCNRNYVGSLDVLLCEDESNQTQIVTGLKQLLTHIKHHTSIYLQEIRRSIITAF